MYDLFFAPKLLLRKALEKSLDATRWIQTGAALHVLCFVIKYRTKTVINT